MKRLIFILLLSSPTTFADVFHTQYSLHCKDPSIIGVHAKIKYKSGRINRFFLPKSESEVYVDLGGESKNDLIENSSFSKNSYVFLDHDQNAINCILNTKNSKFLTIKNNGTYKELALTHSPYLVIRPEQKTEIGNDLPQGLSYSILPDPKNENQFTLVYTAYFSDEDTWSDGKHYTDRSHHQDNQTKEIRYGRSDDIEWVYRVQFKIETDKDGYKKFKALKREFHTPRALGIDSIAQEFDGYFLNNTEHPVLYNDTTYYGKKKLVQNLYVSHSKNFDLFDKTKPLIGYHFVPELIEAPLAREAYLFRHPWMLEYTAQEQAISKNETQDPSQFVYLVVTAQAGDPFPKVDLGWNLSYQFLTTPPQGSLLPAQFKIETERALDRLGEDLFDQQSFSAIRLDQNQTNALTLTKAILEDKAILQAQLQGNNKLNFDPEIKAFLLKKDPSQKSGFSKIELQVERTYLNKTRVFAISKSGTFAGRSLILR